MAFNFTDISNTICNNTTIDYLMLITVFVFILSIVIIFKYIIIKKLKKIAEKTETKYDDMVINVIDKIHWSFYVVLSLYLATHFIPVPDIVKTILHYLITIYVIYYTIKVLHVLIDHGTNILIKKKQEEDKDIDVSIIHLLTKFLKYSLWILVIVVVLSNLGYNVSTLITGLGIGGIAVAFALQNILGDIFASFSIYFDKPFQVGDYIIFGDGMEGIVKRIGIRSTRIQALQGQELVVSNRQLTEKVVHNYKRMEYRRVLFNLYVKYDTDIDILKKIPDIIKDIIIKIDKTKFERAHFSKFGDFGLIFEIVYYVIINDYAKYMDIQQEINLAIKERFKEEEIEMTYTMQTGQIINT